VRVLFIDVACDRLSIFQLSKEILMCYGDEARLLILPREKLSNSIGHPAAVGSFRRAIDDIVYVFGMS